MWEDLYERLEKLYGKLSDEKAYVKEETIDAVRSLAELLPRMNITNDQKLDSLATKLKDSLVGLSAESVKHNPSVREKAVADTQTVFNVMQAFMHPARGGAMELKRAA